MSDKLICARCSKPIKGIIKIVSKVKKTGKKSVNQSLYCDEECFFILNKERALNEFQKERINKKKNKK